MLSTSWVVWRIKYCLLLMILLLLLSPPAQVIYLDPHTTQPASPAEGLEEGEVEEQEDSSYHCPR